MLGDEAEGVVASSGLRCRRDGRKVIVLRHVTMGT